LRFYVTGNALLPVAKMPVNQLVFQMEGAKCMPLALKWGELQAFSQPSAFIGRELLLLHA
jgi:hypothetical protein